MSSVRYITILGFLLTSIGALSSSAAEPEIIEEAEMLIEEKSNTPVSPDQSSSILRKNRIRSYVLIDGSRATGSNDDKTYFPNVQLSFSGDFHLRTESFFLIDVVADYDRKSEYSDSFFNQVGFRSKLSEHVQYFIGKERNRRSPGLIVSPSDFIYANTSLPGQREDRKGVWLARASYQEINHSFDLIALPVQHETAEGTPESRQDSVEGAIRGLKQFSNFDISFMVGKYLGTSRGGLSVQTFLENKYKLYLEVGTQEQSKLYNNATRLYPVQRLFGIGYEGTQDFAARLEFYENGQGLNPDEFSQMMQMFALAPGLSVSGNSQLNPFLRQKYLIASLSWMEIFDKYNVTFSVIKSVEDDSALGVSRLEYMATDKALFGASLNQVHGGLGSQYRYRNHDSQAIVDLKYSF
jgi:hypothetical protein